MRLTYKIIEITDVGVIVEVEKNKVKQIAKDKVFKFAIARVGLYVRHCEHGIYDVVDENGDFELNKYS